MSCHVIALHCIALHLIGTFSQHFSLHCLAVPIDSCQVWEALAAARVVVMALSHSEIPSAPLCVGFQGPRLVRVKSEADSRSVDVHGKCWEPRAEFEGNDLRLDDLLFIHVLSFSRTQFFHHKSGRACAAPASLAVPAAWP